MSLIVTSAAARASHRGRHRRSLSPKRVALITFAVLGAALIFTAAPALGFAVTVLGLP